MSSILKDRAAIITGGNQGLGKAIARAFVQAGANLMLCARDESKLAGVAAELRNLCNTGQWVESMCEMCRNRLSRNDNIRGCTNPKAERRFQQKDA